MVRKLGLAVAAASAAAAGIYFFVYLVRWEWNRPCVSGVIFVAVETLVLGAALIEPDDTPSSAASAPRLRRRVPCGRSCGPLGRRRAVRSAWLDPKRGGTNVFVPVLMGAGLVRIGAGVARGAHRAAGRPTGHGGRPRQASSTRSPTRRIWSRPTLNRPAPSRCSTAVGRR